MTKCKALMRENAEFLRIKMKFLFLLIVMHQSLAIIHSMHQIINESFMIWISFILLSTLRFSWCVYNWYLLDQYKWFIFGLLFLLKWHKVNCSSWRFFYLPKQTIAACVWWHKIMQQMVIFCDCVFERKVPYIDFRLSSLFRKK